MRKLLSIFRILLYTFIFVGIFNSLNARVLEFNSDAKSISNYFSGLISFDNFEYKTSESFFKKIKGFEGKNKKYSSRLIQSYVNLQNYDEAYKYSKSLEKSNESNFESNLFLGLYEFKNNNYDKASFYFKRLKTKGNKDRFFEILESSLNVWPKISESKKKEDIKLLYYENKSFESLQIIESTFAHCFLETVDAEKKLISLFNNEQYNFSRYNFFVSNYFFNKNKLDESKKLINSAHEKYPGNLLIHQFKKVLINNEKNNNVFNCKNSSHIMAEIFYILSNILSSEREYKLSNFFISLSKFLNPNFHSYNTLLAENYIVLEKYETAEVIYKKLFKAGSVYKWYSAKQIASIMEEKKNDMALKYISDIYKTLKNPGIYETFDLANFHRNNESYKESINLYSKILLKINKKHNLYPEILERRGMAYERNNKWELGEKDLIESLKVKPNEPYVMNYLAYSWIEQNTNIDQALEMLKQANDLKKNNGYITDSLGWALYKTKNFSEAKKYLEIAMMLLPRDPIINDHYADCLWMNNHKIQARYYWNNVLKSDKAEDELKSKVEKKMLFGLENI